MSSSQELNRPVIKKGQETSDSEIVTEEVADKFNDQDSKLLDGKLVSPELKVIIESNPAIEQSISKIKEEVQGIFFNPTKKDSTISNKSATQSDGTKPFEHLNNLLADNKIKAMVDMIGGKEAHGILVETLTATNSGKSVQEKQSAILNGVKKFQSSINNDSIIDISKHLLGFSKPYNK